MNMKSRIDCYRDHSEVRYSGNLQGPLVAELDKSTSPLFHQSYFAPKKTSKSCTTGPLCGESTGYRWIPHTEGQ